MLGCGYHQDDDTKKKMEEDDDEDNYVVAARETIALGVVSPWFWLHNFNDVPGSYRLEGAAGPLYMGGHLE
jgi:hypothetical protein